jgi:hypothetical protein
MSKSLRVFESISELAASPNSKTERRRDLKTRQIYPSPGSSVATGSDLARCGLDWP